MKFTLKLLMCVFQVAGAQHNLIYNYLLNKKKWPEIVKQNKNWRSENLENKIRENYTLGLHRGV